MGGWLGSRQLSGHPGSFQQVDHYLGPRSTHWGMCLPPVNEAPEHEERTQLFLAAQSRGDSPLCSSSTSESLAQRKEVAMDTQHPCLSTLIPLPVRAPI